MRIQTGRRFAYSAGAVEVAFERTVAVRRGTLGVAATAQLSLPLLVERVCHGSGTFSLY